jgi:hypothetical protein
MSLPREGSLAGQELRPREERRAFWQGYHGRTC